MTTNRPENNKVYLNEDGKLITNEKGLTLDEVLARQSQPYNSYSADRYYSNEEIQKMAGPDEDISEFLAARDKFEASKKSQQKKPIRDMSKYEIVEEDLESKKSQQKKPIRDMSKYEVVEEEPTTLLENVGKNIKYGAKAIGSFVKSSGSDLLKGLAEGSLKLGSDLESLLMNPSRRDVFSKATPEQVEEQAKIQAKPQPDVQAFLTKKLDENFPTEKTFIGQSLRASGQYFPEAAATSLAAGGMGAVSTAGRSLLAGTAGHTAKELGAPEWVQSFSKLAAFLSPDLFGRLIERGSKADIIRMGRAAGLTDAQIAPLLNAPRARGAGNVIESSRRTRWFSPYAKKTGRTEHVLEETKAGLSNQSERLANSAEAAVPLSLDRAVELMEDFGRTREYITGQQYPGLADEINFFLDKGAHTGERMINTYRRINQRLGDNIDNRRMVQDLLTEYMHDVSEVLGNSFQDLNQVYQNYYRIQEILAPARGAVQGSPAVGKAGFYSLISNVVGYTAAAKSFVVNTGMKKLSGAAAREILINPRLQQWGQKFNQAVANNQFRIAAQAGKEIVKIVHESNPSSNIIDPTEKDIEEQYGKNNGQSNKTP